MYQSFCITSTWDQFQQFWCPEALELNTLGLYPFQSNGRPNTVSKMLDLYKQYNDTLHTVEAYEVQVTGTPNPLELIAS